MLVGLQGAGKTTTAAKIAKRLTERDRRKVLMASLDVKRPAAQEQLAVLGRQVGVDTLPIVPARIRSQSPGAPRPPRGCKATTSCCSTPRGAPISTSR
jgi:CO dehydrogenase nickel-insertion accessory protein CooC1